MIISHSHKFIFIHIQRTGGSTLINLLKSQMGDDVKIISQHGNAKSSEIQVIHDHKDYFTFAFVRNPWDRILSWYLLINKDNQGTLEEEIGKFENFLELDLVSPIGNLDFHYNQLDYLSNDQGEILTNNLYKFEDYEKEIESLFKVLNLPMIEIPRINPTWNKNYKDYYTQKSQELITQKCKKDIDYFNYTF